MPWRSCACYAFPIMLCIAGLLVALAAPVAGAFPAIPDTAGVVRDEQALRAYAQGRLLEDEGQLREALGAYVRAFGLDHDALPIARHIAENWFQLAAAQVRVGRYEDAQRSLERVAELAPSRPGQVFLQGFVDEHLGRVDDAIARYRRHLEVHAGDQLTRQRLVTLLARQR